MAVSSHADTHDPHGKSRATATATWKYVVVAVDELLRQSGYAVQKHLDTRRCEAREPLRGDEITMTDHPHFLMPLHPRLVLALAVQQDIDGMQPRHVALATTYQQLFRAPRAEADVDTRLTVVIAVIVRAPRRVVGEYHRNYKINISLHVYWLLSFLCHN